MKLQWYFPEDLKEVPKLLQRDGVQLHAGGTGLLRTNLGHFSGLVDIGRLGLKYIREQNGRVVLGAGCTYADAADWFGAPGRNPDWDHGRHPDSAHGRDHGRDGILGRSLGLAASTPLRNRISLGGGLAMAPFWSDLVGPLLALEAEINLLGRDPLLLSEYLLKRKELKRLLITSIQFNAEPWQCYYFRQTRTRVDYPAFTLSILLKAGAGSVQDVRIVFTGAAAKFVRCLELEEAIRGKAPGGLDPDKLAAGLDIQFPQRISFSPEYLRHRAALQLKRGLKALLGQLS